MNISMTAIKEELGKWAAKVNIDDIKAILAEPERLKALFNNKYLKKFTGDLKLLLSLLKDYWNGAYREIPWGSIAAIAGALLYVLSPLDLIPDLLPFIGFLDDALVVSCCLSLVSTDLENYRVWKTKQLPDTGEEIII